MVVTAISPMLLAATLMMRLITKSFVSSLSLLIHCSIWSVLIFSITASFQSCPMHLFARVFDDVELCGHNFWSGKVLRHFDVGWVLEGEVFGWDFAPRLDRLFHQTGFDLEKLSAVLTLFCDCLALRREHQDFVIADLPDIFRHFLHDEVLTSFLDHFWEVEEDAAKTGRSDVISHQICIRADEDLAIVPFFGEASE